MRSLIRVPHRSTWTLAPLSDFPNEMNRLLQRFFDGPATPAGGEGQAFEFAPEINVRENDDALVLSAELAGVAPEDIEVTVENGVLTLQGEKKAERVQDNENQHVVERRFGRFRRSFTLPSAIDAERVEARHENGVLTVVLPKSSAHKARKIDVQAK